VTFVKGSWIQRWVISSFCTLQHCIQLLNSKGITYLYAINRLHELMNLKHAKFLHTTNKVFSNMCFVTNTVWAKCRSRETRYIYIHQICNASCVVEFLGFFKNLLVCVVRVVVVLSDVRLSIKLPNYS
jgi:hypothetical protein